VHALGEHAGIRGPRGRGGHQALLRQLDQLGIGARSLEPLVGAVALRLRGRGDDRVALADVGRQPGQDLAQDRAQREHVRALVEPVHVARGLFRRHVGRRAHHRSDHRIRAAARRLARAHRLEDRQLRMLHLRALLVGRAAAREHLREAPVDHLHLAERADHDVRRLQVAVDHAARVRVAHRLADRLEDRDQPLAVRAGVLALGEQRRQRAPLDELHREEGPLVLHRAELVHRHDARMLQLAADLRLLDEALHDLGPVGEALVEHLDRDVAPEIRVVALQDHAHPAARDLAQELVVAPADRNRRLLLRGGIDHRRGVRRGFLVAQHDARSLARALLDQLQNGGGGIVGRRQRGLVHEGRRERGGGARSG
jgi:hypothetical protein